MAEALERLKLGFLRRCFSHTLAAVKLIVLLLLAMFAVLYTALCLIVYATQRSLIYFPTPERNVAAAQILRLGVGDAVLKVWQVARRRSPAVLYFGGNAEDVAGEIAPLSRALPEYTLYLVNYRGYGGSTGTPSEAALFGDAVTLFDRVRADHEHIAVIGRSLGSGVAVHLAAERPVERLVLVTPYDSIERVAQRFYWFLPIRWLLRDKFDSVRRVPRIHCPTLIVVAAYDEVIPRLRSDVLASAFPRGQVRTVVLAQAAHNFSSDDPALLAALQAFF